MTLSEYTSTHGTLHSIQDYRGHIAWRLGSGNSVELFSLGVSELRKGYGRSLVRQMLKMLEHTQVWTVYGFTRERLVHAQLFYLAVGFKLTKLPAFYSEGDAILFSQQYETLQSRHKKASDMKVYSQNGEDAVLHRLLYIITNVDGVYPKTFVEIGVSVEENFIECNTGRLLDQGWSGVWIDEDGIDHPIAYRSHVLPDNINQLFETCRVSKDLGVLSIDVDGIDYYLWSALDEEYRPAVVIIEYNSQIPNDQPLVVPYSPTSRWDGTDYFGANARALVELAHSKGYLLYSDVRHVNLVFVRGDLAPSNLCEPDYTSLSGAIVASHPADPHNRKYLNPSTKEFHSVCNQYP